MAGSFSASFSLSFSGGDGQSGTTGYDPGGGAGGHNARVRAQSRLERVWVQQRINRQTEEELILALLLAEGEL